MKYLISLAKMTICLALVCSTKILLVKTNTITRAEIGGWFGSKVAQEREMGTVAEMVGGYTGAEAGASVGATAGEWIGGAIGTLGGPAGAVFGVWAGGIVGGVAGGL